MIDFKIRHLIEEGNRQKGVMVIYEGSTTTKDEIDIKTRQVKPVRRYRRTAILEEIPFDIHNDDLPHGLRHELKK